MSYKDSSADKSIDNESISASSEVSNKQLDCRASEYFAFELIKTDQEKEEEVKS